MASIKDIRNKTCLVTGGASGLGALYVEAFLKEGAKHVAMLDIAEDKGRETSQELNKTYPGKVTFIRCDVSDEGSITRAFDEVLRQFKQLDIVVNNAGILNDSPDWWRKSCEVNVEGLVSFTMKAVKHMRVDEGGAGGTIVNVSSVAGLLPAYSSPIYCGTKAAVLHFSQSISVDPFHEKTGIRVLTICFGPTDTALMKQLETRVYNDKLGESFKGLISNLGTQKAESAVASFMTMFKNGANASVWLSQNDRPIEDITPKIKAFYQMFL